MLRRLLQFPNKSQSFRQCIATLLLLFFVWDAVDDAIPPRHAALDFSEDSAVTISSGGVNNPDDDHPDCGLPDHGCALTHHHHFPAVIGSNNSTIFVVALEAAMPDQPAASGHAPLSDHPIRAPPCV